MPPTIPLPIPLAHYDADQRGTVRLDVCPAPPVMRGLSGLWQGTVFRAGESAGTPFSLLQEADDRSPDGVVGRLAFTGADDAPANVQLLEASATTFVALVGPYRDPASNAEVVTVLEARRAGDRLYGTYRAHPTTGGRVTDGHFVATRTALAA